MSDKVKEFVRSTLGCQCPEEVLETIEVDSEVNVGEHTVKKWINVGNRLLIYIVEGKSDEDLEGLFFAGVEERDSKGFNRFRLVVLSDGEIDFAWLQELMKDHEKVHLHVIGKHLIDF